MPHLECKQFFFGGSRFLGIQMNPLSYLVMISMINCAKFSSDQCTDSCEVVNRYKNPRYLLYDVNLGEGFNLRRDVYIRMATLAKWLGGQWSLVLPEWIHVPHWNSQSDLQMEQWSTYFDIRSLNHFVSVIEMQDFLQLFPDKIQVNSILSLEHLDHFDGGDFEENYELIATNRTRYYVNYGDGIRKVFNDNPRFIYQRLFEIRIEGFETTLLEIIEKHFTTDRIVKISNAETILHSHYGSQLYWMARRSMRFSSHLRALGDDFRRKYLDSFDSQDGTELNEDWRTIQSHEHTRGGPYVAVHFRRGDFLTSRADLVPDIDCAIRQINFVASNLLEKHFEKIYISTDAEEGELKRLTTELLNNRHRVFNFEKMNPKLNISPGEVAIVDQWISAHAEYFIGTLESTFSLRIQEEREILGFNSNSTHNALCAQCDLRLLLKVCRQNSSWRIVY